MVKPGGVQKVADFFKDLFDAWAHDSDQFRAGDLAARAFPAFSWILDLDHVAVINAGCHHAAMEGFQPLGGRPGYVKPLRDVRGHMIAPQSNGITENHVFLHEQGNRCGPPAHVNAGGAQFTLIFDQGGHARCVSRRRQPRDLKIAAFDAINQILHNHAVNGQQVHVHLHLIPDLTARVDQARPMIDGEIHRLGVQNFASFADIRGVASRHRAGNVLFAYGCVVQFNLSVQTIGTRARTGKTRHHMVNTNARHFLSSLNNGAHGTLGFLHHIDFAEFHTARARRRSTDNPETGLPRQGPDAILGPEMFRPVKPKYKASNLGCSYIQNGNHAFLHGDLAHITHRAL